jgi:RNA polymerase sigma-70 factor, ECF subfamily
MPFTPDEFTRMYRRYALRLLRYLTQRTRDPELSADLLAETFERALRSAGSYRGSADRELEGWLWRIAGNVISESERRQRLAERQEGQLAERRIALTDAEIERIIEISGIEPYKETVARNLARLPYDQRQAVCLHVVEELDYEEVARLTNTTTATARARVSRALRTLRAALAPEHDAWRQENP